MGKDKSKSKGKDQSYTKKEVNLANFYDDAIPTVFEGGLDRMVKIWNDLRDRNTGAYGSGICSIVDDWGGFSKKCSDVTACSPFTANVAGILFDPKGAAGGRSYPVYTTAKGTKPLPVDFYHMQQGNFSGTLPKGVSKDQVNHSAEALLAFNLGYEIQAKDLRRGDHVGIDWSNGNGHAVFVWDVHTKVVGDHDEVDAFCFISANGSIIIKHDPDDPPAPGGKPTISAKTGKERKRLYKTYTGAGITIGGCGGSKYMSDAKGCQTMAKDWKEGWSVSPKNLGGPFFSDRKDHIIDAHWYAIPRTHGDDIDMSTFKEGGPKHIIDYSYTGGGNYVRSLRAVRFWGFPPPDRTPDSAREGTDFELAKQYAAKTGWKLKESYATGTGPAPKPTIVAAQPTDTKGDVETIKDKPVKKAEQPKKPEHYTKFQLWVEDAIGTLFDHDWLKNDPGDRGNPNDDASKKAIKEFQEKMKLSPATGAAGPKTRDALEEAIKLATAGELPPWKKPPPAPKTKLEKIVWLRNRVPPGGELYFSVHGIVSKLSRLEITFKDRKSNKTANMPCEIETDAAGVIERPIGIPKDFADGAELLATFQGTSSDGVNVKFESKVPLYIGGSPSALAAE